MRDKKLSNNFTLFEMIKSKKASELGIENIPDCEQIENITELVRKALQPGRYAIGKPVNVNSGFRNEQVNAAVNGSSRSDHLEGMAADVTCTNKKDNVELFNFFLTIDFKQLIWYFAEDKYPTFLHISYDPDDNRGEVLYCYHGIKNGKPVRKYRYTKNP